MEPWKQRLHKVLGHAGEATLAEDLKILSDPHIRMAYFAASCDIIRSEFPSRKDALLALLDVITRLLPLRAEELEELERLIIDCVPRDALLRARLLMIVAKGKGSLSQELIESESYASMLAASPLLIADVLMFASDAERASDILNRGFRDQTISEDTYAHFLDLWAVRLRKKYHLGTTVM